MNALQQLTDAPAWPALGWTVPHFLWQGTVIALAASALLRALRNSWTAGFLLMSARYTRHWLWARRLKSHQVTDPDARWQALFQSLKEDLGVPQAVRLLQSGLAETAMVVGWFKPVILVPVSAFTSLTPRPFSANGATPY